MSRASNWTKVRHQTIIRRHGADNITDQSVPYYLGKPPKKRKTKAEMRAELEQIMVATAKGSAK
jgi:hypothetical protein